MCFKRLQKNNWLLVIGIMLNAIGDMWYYYLETFGQYTITHPVNLFWWSSYLVMIYAFYKHKDAIQLRGLHFFQILIILKNSFFSFFVRIGCFTLEDFFCAFLDNFSNLFRVFPFFLEQPIIFHSCDPNSHAIPSGYKYMDIALKDIQRGEELTWDYSVFCIFLISKFCECFSIPITKLF